MKANQKPAKHTKNSFYDQQSVGMVSAWIAQTHRAMPDLKANDKWPNIDGYIELTDENGFPIGNVKVQIKKLSIASAKNKKHSFKNEKFLSYCRESSDWIPILFIGVDIKAKRAYWLHIDSDFVLKLKGSKTISLVPTQVISDVDTGYIEEWKMILQNYQTKSREFEQYKKAFSILSGVVTPALGATDQKFVKIHEYLDKLNGLLDGKFRAVKRVYYPSTWKLGFGYYVYKPTELIYTLYPIPLNKNDVQIKQLDGDLFKLLRKEGLGFTAHSSENPIETKPNEVAIEEIKEKTLYLLKRKLLRNSGDAFLAEEYVFSFIDNFYTQMGLPEKDAYTVKELLHGFTVYMPFWLSEAYTFLKETNRNQFNDRLTNGRIRYYDPEWINEIMSDERHIIVDRVQERIKSNQAVPSLPAGNEKLPFGLFAEFLEELRKNHKVLNRVYKKRDPKNFETNGGTFIWDLFTKDDIAQNFRTVISNLETSYEHLVSSNFPELKDELSLMGNADKLVAELVWRDNHPTYRLLFLKSKEGIIGDRIEVADEELKKDIDAIGMFEQDVRLRGVEYKLLDFPHSDLSFLFHDAPLLNLTYKLLERKLENYFSKLS